MASVSIRKVHKSFGAVKVIQGIDVDIADGEFVVMGIRRMISGGDAATEWNAVMATAILAMIPPALVVILMQKWFVKGLVDSEK